MGHSDASTTLKYYCGTEMNSLKAASERLEKALEKKENKTKGETESEEERETSEGKETTEKTKPESA